MAQASDYTVDNGTGAAVRSDINTRLAALFTNHSGTTDTAMVEKYAYQTWADTTADQLKLRNSSNDAWIPLRGLDGEVIASSGVVGKPGIHFSGDTDTGIYRPAANALAFSTGGSKRLELKDVGSGNGDNSLFWTANVNPISNNVDGIQFTETGRINIGNFENCLVLNRNGTNGVGTIVGIRYATTNVGSITVTGSATSYNTSSDYRLKENVVALTGAKARLNDLKVKRFNFIADPSVTVDGFLAHEVTPIVPEAIFGTKDEVDSNGDPVYQGIDQAKLVPLLTAALQEAFAEIAALTARVETLEAA